MIEVSFIIPAYNAETTLKLCLESVLNQTFPMVNAEVIVVDNNSTDQTAAIASSFGVQVISEKNQGRSFARNTGARAAKGMLLAFVDADVILHHEWLKSIITALKGDNVGAVQGPIRPSRSHGNKSLNDYRYRAAQESTHSSFLLLNLTNKESPMVNTAACIYTKAAFDSVGGFDTDLLRHEDIDMSKRVLLHGFNLAVSADAQAEVIFNGTGWFSYFMRTYEDGYLKADYLAKWEKFLFANEASSRESDLTMFWFEVPGNLFRGIVEADFYYWLKALNSLIKSFGRISRMKSGSKLKALQMTPKNRTGYVFENNVPVIEYDMHKVIVKKVKVNA